MPAITEILRKVYRGAQGKILTEMVSRLPVTNRVSVHLVKTSITTAELNEMLLKLSDLFARNSENHANSLSRYLTFAPITFNGRSEKEIRAWQTNSNRLGLKEEEIRANAGELFKYLREEVFKIDDEYTGEQAYRIMLFRYEIMINNWNFTTGGRITLADDVSIDTILELEERNHEFPGVITTLEPIREYVDATEEAHVLGYIRSISQNRYDELKDEGYDNDDLIGYSGIELQAERYLRGRKGKMSIEVDTTGKLTQKKETVAAVPGSDVILTIDTNLQKVAMESVARNIAIIKTKRKTAIMECNAAQQWYWM